ncbi:hypothetical protein BGZ99_000075 [Dissophora globulifera]|uniref:Uncharacterized protein n=1 Tax=Dissophora globulifera TaxID=979702 RepID=A0A9P6UZK6_9FUNG|nr:hypothetical protein BGZ99_000075 [Dissophora globulifera]
MTLQHPHSPKQPSSKQPQYPPLAPLPPPPSLAIAGGPNSLPASRINDSSIKALDGQGRLAHARPGLTQESSPIAPEEHSSLEGASTSSVGSESPSDTGLAARFQDHLRLFFSMHHKLFDLVAFYVVMFAINGQMTSLPTRLEWIGFCVQSIVALRRAFQTSIKHGLGLTSFLGMLDLLVGQLFLHQDRLGLLPTVANILVYFYVINLTRGLVFGDSVSCLLWFLFGLVDVYRKDPSSASILDLTPYKVIPVHTVGFGLYILMSELVDVMLHSAEPGQTQGRYLNYVGAQKEGPVAIRSSSRRSINRSADPSSNLRFELCITEITPFTVSFCLNALSDAPSPDQSSAQNPTSNNSSTSTSIEGSGNGGPVTLTEHVDLSAIKVGSAVNSSSSSSTTKTSKSTATPRIISTSDIVFHVNYIPWQQVRYHLPDDQSFTLYGLTPSTDYEIEMKVHQFSSFVTRVGTRAAPPGTIAPTIGPAKPTKSTDPGMKSTKNRKSKKGQKNQKEQTDKSGESSKTKSSATTSTSTSSTSSGMLSEPNGSAGVSSLPLEAATSPSSSVAVEEDTPSTGERRNSNELLFEQLQASIQASIEASSATKLTLKKLKRDQNKTEASLRQELEGIGRGQAKALVQDQKRRQKLSFLQESIKQADVLALSLQEELVDLRTSTQSSQPDLDELTDAIKELDQQIQSSQANVKMEVGPLKTECQRLQSEIKRLEGERTEWASKAAHLRESEVAPLQLRLQRLEQQQIVWKVAAAASKDKDREASSRLATLEEDIQKRTVKADDLQRTMQSLKGDNARLKESVEREMEIWETLEREADVEEAQAAMSSFPMQTLAYGSGGQQYSPQALAQPVRHHDMSMDGPARESQYWRLADDGAGAGSGRDLWFDSHSGLDSGMGGAPSAWEMASGVSPLDSSRGAWTTETRANPFDHSLPDQR